jgi:electron transfer flavoprotein beta subunit
MKILVCVKGIPEDATKRIDPDTFRLDRTGPAVINGPDRHAVEEAVQIKKRLGEAEVVLVSLGPPEAASALRAGLAMGADRTVLVSDEVAAGSDLVATSKLLAAALAREQGDLILFGQQAADSNGALLWAAIANRLRLPLVSRAVSLAFSNGSVRVRQRADYGQDVIEAPLPCVVAVSASINEPRVPSFRQLKTAGDKPHEVLSLADLGVPPGEAGDGRRTEVLALHDPPKRGQGAIRIVDTGDAAQQIFEYLVAAKLVM